MGLIGSEEEIGKEGRKEGRKVGRKEMDGHSDSPSVNIRLATLFCAEALEKRARTSDTLCESEDGGCVVKGWCHMVVLALVGYSPEIGLASQSAR